MKEKRIVLFGAGMVGQEALNEYGVDRVAFFCDNAKAGRTIGDVPVISLEELKKIHNEYDVVVTPQAYDVRQDIGMQLEGSAIPYTFFEKSESTIPMRVMHIHGEAPDSIIFDHNDGGMNGLEWRTPITINLFKKVFEKYSDEFRGKQIDAYMYMHDFAYEANAIAEGMDLEHIFAYSTLYITSDRVVSVPDYRSFIDEEEYHFEDTPQRCREAANETWVDKRVFWRGNVITDQSRRWLMDLGRKHPDYFKFEDVKYVNGDEVVPMYKSAKYKYLIDVRGTGWTDRVKVLMQLGRPVFLADRPYREWYFDKLEPMVNYVPIREDLSDLVERYEYLESHPDVYEKMCQNTKRFAEENLSPKAILKYMYETLMKYGIKQG